MIDDFIKQNSDTALALYGLGIETERLIAEKGDELNIICLLDSYRQEGEIYGYPIMPVERAIRQGVRSILVIARPGSCKVIARKIRDICVENGVTLFDVRGKDLLAENRVIYDFKEVDGVSASTRNELFNAIDKADVVSFDFFDTLVMRKLLSYTDLFEIMERKLLSEGVEIEDFATKRLAIEKQLSVGAAPKLSEIYANLTGEPELVEKLTVMEWELDSCEIEIRDGMKDVLEYATSHGKRVFITTDCYYSKEQIKNLIQRLGLDGFEDVLVSSEYGTSKSGELFEILKKMVGGDLRILHIGDDEYADIDKGREHGIEGFRIYKAEDLYSVFGGLGTEKYVRSLADKVKLGLFLWRVFSDPFLFEKNDGRLSIYDAYDIGFGFVAPMVSDFLIWMIEETRKWGAEKVLLCARDGYLLNKLIKFLPKNLMGGIDYCYFLTSRVAAIRSGVCSYGDIEYVDGMKFSGDRKHELMARFGISEDEADDSLRNDAILRRAEKLRKNYHKYVEKLGGFGRKIGVFDFVAKGTTQLFLEKICPSDSDIQGFYFLWLESESMKERGLHIEPFYEEIERDGSVIFNHYYILETVLTSPDAGILEFDEEGEPVYAEETRSKEDLQCILKMQEGVLDYFRELTALLPDINEYDVINKPLDEAFLALINKFQILDRSFLSLTVEDPFFNRMTPVADLL